MMEYSELICFAVVRCEFHKVSLCYFICVE